MRVSYLFYCVFGITTFWHSNLCLGESSPTQHHQVGEKDKQYLHIKSTHGDLIFELWPEAAPNHINQISKMVDAEIYDYIPFTRIEPNFVLQIADRRGRLKPLTDTQKDIISLIKAEFSNLPHLLGTVSMARWDDNPDSAESSFSIVLNKSPHLDGKYTVLGKVSYGFSTIKKIIHQSRKRNSNNSPIFILKATMLNSINWGVFDIDADKEAYQFLEEHQGRIPEKLVSKNTGAIPTVLFYLLFFIFGICICCLIFWRQVPPKIMKAAVMLIFLVAAFGLMIFLTQKAYASSFYGIVILMISLAIAKSMSYFESN